MLPVQYIAHCTPLFPIFLIKKVVDVCELVLFIVNLLLYIAVGFVQSEEGDELDCS